MPPERTKKSFAQAPTTPRRRAATAVPYPQALATPSRGRTSYKNKLLELMQSDDRNSILLKIRAKFLDEADRDRRPRDLPSSVWEKVFEYAYKLDPCFLDEKPQAHLITYYQTLHSTDQWSKSRKPHAKRAGGKCMECDTSLTSQITVSESDVPLCMPCFMKLQEEREPCLGTNISCDPPPVTPRSHVVKHTRFRLDHVEVPTWRGPYTSVSTSAMELVGTSNGASDGSDRFSMVQKSHVTPLRKRTEHSGPSMKRSNLKTPKPSQHPNNDIIEILSSSPIPFASVDDDAASPTRNNRSRCSKPGMHGCIPVTPRRRSRSDAQRTSQSSAEGSSKDSPRMKMRNFLDRLPSPERHRKVNGFFMMA